MNCAAPILISYKLPSEVTGELREVKRYVPCGKCLYCRKRRAKEWRFRLNEEYEKTKQNGYETLFITYTYAPEFYRSDGDMPYRDIQLLHKSLRHISPFRFYAIRDYGYNGTMRCHWHVLYFLESDKVNEFISSVTDIWGKGIVNIKSAIGQHISYISNYTSMCVPPNRHLRSVTRMSLRPAIGYSFFLSDRFLDCYVKGNNYLWKAFTTGGKTLEYRESIPRYYMRKLNDGTKTYESELYSISELYRRTNDAIGKQYSYDGYLSKYKIVSGYFDGDMIDGYNGACVHILTGLPVDDMPMVINTDYGECTMSRCYYNSIVQSFEKYCDSKSNQLYEIKKIDRFNLKHLKRWLTFFSPPRFVNRSEHLLTSVMSV